MEATFVVPVLALVTLGAFTIFALVSKKKVEERKHDTRTPKSTLAKDAPSKGTPVDT